ncbi:hypothetical protein RHGRI_034124 [Rhododendron griersonianum]|uniref:Alpha-L-arabinofuranosidase 1 catalytic domain-containing protein n=1 Tax=Rhododendron griersonianum TaxID=479676 RepID=A0AAV6HZA6_9ERIC|nr:hypothetical protein RHGRI_034124 [Rhododendron griersonianum]
MCFVTETTPMYVPDGGVGVNSPRFWGMNVEQGKKYKVVLYIRSLLSVNILVSLTGSNGLQTLATANIIAADVSNWTKTEILLEAKETNHNARLQLTTSRRVVWFDQVSAMPLDTYKTAFVVDFSRDERILSVQSGLRSFDILSCNSMTLDFKFFNIHVEFIYLKISLPTDLLVETWFLKRSFYHVCRFETLIHQIPRYLCLFVPRVVKLGLFHLTEDLGAAPVWVFNNAIMMKWITLAFCLFCKHRMKARKSWKVEFAKGALDSGWGSVRAAMGHLEPFDLRYVAVGNEDCGKKNYRGNYLKFYDAIRHAYPDIIFISNCGGSTRQLYHPTHFYDCHVRYDSHFAACTIEISIVLQIKFWFSVRGSAAWQHTVLFFDLVVRITVMQKWCFLWLVNLMTHHAVVQSEYAVTGNDASTGSLLAALAEFGFLTSLERNRSIVLLALASVILIRDFRICTCKTVKGVRCSVRAAMGHPEPFNLRYVAVGNEDCGKNYYGMLLILSIIFVL